MKKNLLLLLIMAAAMTGIYAGNYDLPPYEPYLKDITYNPKTQELSFEDTYKADEAINRLHIVEFYYRTNDTKIIGIVDGANPGWTYGDGNGSTQIHDVDTGEPVKQRFYGGKQKGGKHYLKISKGIAACLKAGEGRLFIAIRGHESDDKWEKNTAYEVAQGGKNERGCHIKNNIESGFDEFRGTRIGSAERGLFRKRLYRAVKLPRHRLYFNEASDADGRRRVVCQRRCLFQSCGGANGRKEGLYLFF